MIYYDKSCFFQIYLFSQEDKTHMFFSKQTLPTHFCALTLETKATVVRRSSEAEQTTAVPRVLRFSGWVVVVPLSPFHSCP